MTVQKIFKSRYLFRYLLQFGSPFKKGFNLIDIWRYFYIWFNLYYINSILFKIFFTFFFYIFINSFVFELLLTDCVKFDSDNKKIIAESSTLTKNTKLPPFVFRPAIVERYAHPLMVEYFLHFEDEFEAVQDNKFLSLIINFPAGANKSILMRDARTFICEAGVYSHMGDSKNFLEMDGHVQNNLMTSEITNLYSEGIVTFLEGYDPSRRLISTDAARILHIEQFIEDDITRSRIYMIDYNQHTSPWNHGYTGFRPTDVCNRIPVAKPFNKVVTHPSINFEPVIKILKDNVPPRAIDRA